MHHGCTSVHPGEYNDLFKEGGGNRNVCDRVGVGVQEHRCAERVHERVRQEIIKHVIVLCVSGWRVHVGDRVCPGVVQRNLPVVGEQIPRCTIVDRHCDESVPVEAPSSIAHAG